MKWYEIGFNDEQMKQDWHERLIATISRLWERNNKPDDFALLGTHTVETLSGKFTVYYLTPAAQKYCSSQLLTAYQPKITEKQPSPEFLKVVAGDKNAMRLLS
jgi:hypothetical protein